MLPSFFKERETASSPFFGIKIKCNLSPLALKREKDTETEGWRDKKEKIKLSKDVQKKRKYKIVEERN